MRGRPGVAPKNSYLALRRFSSRERRLEPDDRQSHIPVAKEVVMFRISRRMSAAAIVALLVAGLVVLGFAAATDGDLDLFGHHGGGDEDGAGHTDGPDGDGDVDPAGHHDGEDDVDGAGHDDDDDDAGHDDDDDSEHEAGDDDESHEDDDD